MDKLFRYYINLKKIIDVKIPRDKLTISDIELFNSENSQYVLSKYTEININTEANNENELFYMKELKQQSEKTQEYIINNYHINSCILGILINTYKDNFEKAKISKKLQKN